MLIKPVRVSRTNLAPFSSSFYTNAGWSGFLRAPEGLPNLETQYSYPCIFRFGCLANIIGGPGLYDYKTMYIPNKLFFLRFINEIICYNQGAFVQYWYECSEMHKQVRQTLEKGDCDEVRNNLDRLISYSYSELKSIARTNFQYIYRYFRNRPSPNPRISIKASYQDRIVDLFRDKQVKAAPTLVEKNSGFKSCVESGKYFFCNDIPKAAKYFGYENPRLKPECAKRYETFLSDRLMDLLRRLMESESPQDHKWVQCWRGYAGEECQDVQSAYKSTIITPMTLFNASLSEGFRKKFLISDEFERTTWGFLCLDHVSTGYFQEKNDVCFLYIMADILSLYIIARSNYTTNSETFGDAVEKCGVDSSN